MWFHSAKLTKGRAIADRVGWQEGAESGRAPDAKINCSAPSCLPLSKALPRRGQVSPDRSLSPLGFLGVTEIGFGGPEELNVM